MIIPKEPLATQAQVNYLQILRNDLGFNMNTYKAILKADYGKWYFDELSITEASELIDLWIVLKDKEQTE